MKRKALKSLTAKLFAIAGLALKKLAISCSGESAYRRWKAVEDHNCVGESFSYVLEQSLPDRPQVRSVANEADATSKHREVMTVESFEDLGDCLSGFQTEVFTYDFHRKYFAVSRLRQRSAFSEASWWKEFFHKIINFTEDIYDKIIKIHFLSFMAKGILMFLFDFHRPEGIFLAIQKPVYRISI